MPRVWKSSTQSKRLEPYIRITYIHVKRQGQLRILDTNHGVVKLESDVSLPMTGVFY